MAGILGAGLYLPRHRLSGAAIAAAWGRPGGSGERTVAGYDEDALTLAAAAAALTLGGPVAPGALYFASSSAPLAEKSSAALISEALDLPGEVRTADFGGGGRAATSALLLALEGRRPALVAAGECRLAVPGSPSEPFVGDGGAAVLVGEGPVLAEVRGTYSLTREFPDVWRAADDPFIRSGDARFNAQAGFEAAVTAAVGEALKQWDLKPSDIAQTWLGTQDFRAADDVLRKLGLKGPAGAAATLPKKTGLLGAAHPLALLAACLGEATPGEKLLLIGYGDGVDVILLEATARCAEQKGALARALAGARTLDHYNRYLAYRGLVPGQEQPEGFSSTVMMHREATLYRRLVASECPGCGFVLTLDLHTCPKCHHHGEFRPRKLVRTGKIFTTSQEWYYPSPEPPVTMAVVDLDGGGRLTVQMADQQADVPAGTQVELTFRRLHTAGRLPHYYWKARTLTGGDQG